MGWLSEMLACKFMALLLIPQGTVIAAAQIEVVKWSGLCLVCLVEEPVGLEN